MKLFISDVPFSEKVDPRDPLIRQVTVRLPILLTEPTVSSPSQSSSSYPFVLDTGADYATVFLSTLLAFDLSPNGPSGGSVQVILGNGSITQCLRRDVTLWLCSNMPEFADQPLRIDLNGGVVILPSDPQPEHSLLPLLGMNPLLDAGLRVELNASTRRFSVWVPG